jgi:hypothetical protein
MSEEKKQHRFTFRMDADINSYLDDKKAKWRGSKSNVLKRIILEYAEMKGERVGSFIAKK